MANPCVSVVTYVGNSSLEFVQGRMLNVHYHGSSERIISIYLTEVVWSGRYDSLIWFKGHFGGDNTLLIKGAFDRFTRRLAYGNLITAVDGEIFIATNTPRVQLLARAAA